MQNQLEMETVSVRLYKYLCDEVVGSENVVRYRRLYFKLHDDMMYKPYHEFISSGSKAEGLDLPGSDFDVMTLFKLWEVYEYKPRDQEDVLMLDTENALPGFALLKKTDGSSFPYSATMTADGNLISNNEFFPLNSSVLALYHGFIENHGPSTSWCIPIDIDFLQCLKCHTWPTTAKRWLSRFRPSGWPSTAIISKIVSQGCLLVPVGSKSSCTEGNPSEWRFSFSLSEKLLVHSFNHTQLLCYALLKIWLKELLNNDTILNNKLCSYFMKTVLFWILEEGKNLNWNPRNLLHCFLLCIDRLHYWTVCCYFPNYFIPEHNMIAGKLTHDDLAYLSFVLNRMNMRQNWKILFSVPSLCNFLNLPINIIRNPHRLNKLDQAVLSLRTFGSVIVDTSRKCREESLSIGIIYRMIHKDLPNSAQKILTLMFLNENSNILASLNRVNHKNKRGYLDNRGCISRMLINTFHNAEIGWLLLAAFFYSTQEYHKMSRLLQLSSTMFSLKHCFVQNDVNIQSFRDISQLKKMVNNGSFIKRMKYESSRVFNIDQFGMDKMYPFLNEEIPTGQHQSFCLFYYLNFLYSRKQGNSLEAESALQLLKQFVDEESDKPTNIVCLMSSFMLIIRALTLSNDKEGVHYFILRFLKIIKRWEEIDAML